MADKNESMADSMGNGVKSAVNMAKNTAVSVKNAQKAAAKAASGNYVGAAVDVLRDERLRKMIVIAILLPALIFSMLCVFWLYALPTAIFQAIKSALDAFSDEFLAILYSGEHGDVWESFFPALFETIGNSLSRLWKSVFGGDPADDAKDDTNREVDDIEASYLANQQKDAETEILSKKVEEVQKKIDRRIDDVAKEVKNISNASFFQSAFASDYGYSFGNETVSESHGGYNHITYSVGGSTWTQQNSVYKLTSYSVSEPSKGRLSKLDAVRLLSLYTVMKGASVKDVKMSDVERWLGYENGGFLGLKNITNKETVTLPIGSVKVSRWEGTCIPQYMLDQKKIEIGMNVDGASTYYEKTYGVAAADMIVFANGPDRPSGTVDGGSDGDSETLTLYFPEGQFAAATGSDSNFETAWSNPGVFGGYTAAGKAQLEAARDEKIAAHNKEIDDNHQYISDAINAHNEAEAAKPAGEARNLWSGASDVGVTWRTDTWSVTNNDTPEQEILDSLEEVTLVRNYTTYSCSYTYTINVGVRSVNELAAVLGVADPNYARPGDNDADGKEALGDGMNYSFGSGPQAIYQHLSNKYSHNWACAVMGAMANETGWTFDQDLVEYGAKQGFGLLGWTDSKYYNFWNWTNMIRFCNSNGYNWRTTKGQLAYLDHEIEDVAYFNRLKVKMQTDTDLYTAMDAFFRYHQGGGTYHSATYFVQVEYEYAKIIDRCVKQNDWTFEGRVQKVTTRETFPDWILAEDPDTCAMSHEEVSSSGILGGGTGGFSSGEVPSIWSSMDTPTETEVRAMAKAKYGFNDKGVDSMLAYIGGESAGYYAQARNDSYAEYLIACVAVNQLNSFGGDGNKFLSWINSWPGSYYSWGNLNSRINNPTSATLKALYMALVNTNTDALYADGPGYVPSNYIHVCYNSAGDAIYIRKTY